MTEQQACEKRKISLMSQRLENCWVITTSYKNLLNTSMGKLTFSQSIRLTQKWNAKQNFICTWCQGEPTSQPDYRYFANKLKKTLWNLTFNNFLIKIIEASDNLIAFSSLHMFCIRICDSIVQEPHTLGFIHQFVYRYVHVY